jgi:SAM-dependent methyltransferase
MTSGPGRDHWFEDVADHLGAAYLRYSFTKGTEQEVGFLVETLGLEPGQRVLDVGCGPGRHALALARRGLQVTGVDISQRFVDLANATAAAEGLEAQARFQRADARDLRFHEEFDAVISLCQGAFGLAGGAGASSVDPDARVLDGMARALRVGGVLGLSAFSAYFAVRFIEETDTFDAEAGVNHERTSIRSEAGADTETDLWTTCFTPRELRLLCAAAGLDVRHLWAVTPGRYAPNPPDLDHPELFVLATRRLRR